MSYLDEDKIRRLEEALQEQQVQQQQQAEIMQTKL